MHDPSHRLSRFIVGGHAHAPHPLLDRLHRRGFQAPPRTTIPDRQRATFKVRNLRVDDHVGHYAPQLIRLVRFPFALHPASQRGRAGVDRSRPTRPPAVFGHALVARPVAQLPRPVQDRTLARPRRAPSLEWLAARSRGEPAS